MFDKSSIFWEFARKAIHLSALLIVVGYTLLLNYTSDRVAILVMTALLIVLLKIEYWRVEYKPRLAALFNSLFREHEEDNLSGAVFMVISSIICFSAFEYWVAFLALFMAVFGDLFSALIGRAIGKIKVFNNKTLEGTLSGLIANFVVGYLILPNYIWLVVAMALASSLMEVMTNKLDDNLTVPIFAGFVGQMLVYYNDVALPPIDFTFLGLF